MANNPWKPTDENRKVFGGLSILHGDARGGFLAEHEHDEVQVSIHFSCRDRRLEPVHLHIHPSGRPHAGGWPPGDEVIVFHLAPGLLSGVRQEMARGIDTELVPSRASRDVVVEGLGLLVRREYDRNDPVSDLCFESAGFLLARHLLRHHTVFPVAAPGRYSLNAKELDDLRKFIQDHLQGRFSVREMGASIGVGPAILGRKLRAALGKSPWRFVQEQRIGYAKDWLRKTQMPIADLAARLGYTDQSHFTNAFRRATGTTPRAFRSTSA